MSLEPSLLRQGNWQPLIVDIICPVLSDWLFISPDVPPAPAADLDELHHLALLHAQLPVAEGAVVGQHAVQARLRVRSEAQPRLPHAVVICLITRLRILQIKEYENKSS